MLGVKVEPDDSGQGYSELELNLAFLDAPSDQGRAGKWAKHCVTNRKGECAEEKTSTLRRRCGVSTRLSHSEMRLKDTVKHEFQTCDSDMEEESCGTSGHWKPRHSFNDAAALCNDSPKRGGLGRLVRLPTHVCRSCMEAYDGDDLRLHSWAHCTRHFSCELCPKVFLNSADRAEHFRTHISHPLFICERCSITFSNKAQFDRHLGEHGLKQLHKCHLCPEEFNDELKLRVHIDDHIHEGSRCDSGREPIVGRVQSFNCFALKDDPGIKLDEGLPTANHTCNFCGQAFDDESSLGEHVRTEHSGESSISSSQDKKTSISQWFLDNSAVSTEAGEVEHESPSLTECTFLEGFEDKARFESHVRTHLHCNTPVQKVEPWLESSTVETASSVEDRVLHACHLCPEDFNDDDDSRRHIRTEHGSNKKRSSVEDDHAEKHFACEHCSKRFRFKGHLNRHLVTHTGETRYHCHLCPAKFSQNGDLKRHVHRHVGYKQFHCRLCPMQFVVKADMEVHRRTHTGERPFACDRCPASFSASDNLRKHINSHTGVRPHACDKCPRSFTRLSDLKRHVRRHTGERPYSCNSCSRTFTRGHLLRDHVVAAHPSSMN